ncbi:MAG: DUF1343 domain-containing protein, partial [Bacteroidales bacterium]
MKRLLLFLFVTLILQSSGGCQRCGNAEEVVCGAAQFGEYVPLLQNKRIALVANATSQVAGTHLVDTLAGMALHLSAIFSPEHGFRGEAEAGVSIGNGKDLKTGIPIVSLYGQQKRPTAAMLKNIDIVVFDIQDVGARFYTYISTMSYVMDACAANGIPMIILDRPNPNGYYVDGPVLEEEYRSFVGLHPVPVVHGMTAGEYAQMVAGEGWLESQKKLELTVIPCLGYDHTTRYKLPVNPSPNLRDMKSIYLYPSLCLFEGTLVSIGRGTDKPFRQYGHPDFPETGYTFTPVSIKGASEHPKHENRECHGYLLDADAARLEETGELDLSYLLHAYSLFNDSGFFTSFFTKLSGTPTLQEQIVAGWSEEQIRNAWQEDLKAFKKIRK